MRKAQIAVEHLFIVGFSLAIVLISGAYFSGRSHAVNDAAFSSSVNVVGEIANTVSLLGKGTRRFIDVNIPSGVKASSVSHEGIELIYERDSADRHVAFFSDVNLTGRFPSTSGLHKVFIENLGNGLVLIGDGLDDTAPVIVSKAPQGVIEYTDVSLRAITDEFATCRYNEEDGAYDSMPKLFNGSLRIHSSQLNLGSGDYDFFVRCSDDFGNVMNYSGVIHFRIGELYCELYLLDSFSDGDTAKTFSFDEGQSYTVFFAIPINGSSIDVVNASFQIMEV